MEERDFQRIEQMMTRMMGQFRGEVGQELSQFRGEVGHELSQFRREVGHELSQFRSEVGQELSQDLSRFRDQIGEDFRHQLGLQREDFQHKLDMVVEGQQMLVEKLDATRSELKTEIGKVDQRVTAVAADLSSHRRDTEAHRKGWRVREEDGGERGQE